MSTDTKNLKATNSALEISITRPDDWHVHLRDSDALSKVVGHTAFQFARAVVMPNLKPPITSTEQALSYKSRIMDALSKTPVPHSLKGSGFSFEPLMTLYLTDTTSPQELEKAFSAGVVAVKLYPSGATTHSDAGVTNILSTYPALETMQRLGMPLLIHAEVTDPLVDLFDREAVFIERHLVQLRKDFPELKIVMEHITTEEAAHYVQAGDKYLGATITAHHLLYNRNALFTGGIRPHYYCLPVLKREKHRVALVKAATSGSAKFFLGTDSAPHAAHLKEHASGCAGCYTAFSAMELYAEAFDAAGALDQLEAFASFNGADFYGLARNKGRITLRRESCQMPESLAFGHAKLIPLRAGEALPWRFVS
jgi:dihydroorotase